MATFARPAPSSEPATPHAGPVVTSTDVGQLEWDQYVISHPDATVDHLWRWREVFEKVFRHDCVYLVARRRTAIVGVLPLVLFRSRFFGRFVVSVPFLNSGGLLTDDAAAVEALVDRARTVAGEFGASHVELRHRHRQLLQLPWRQHKVGLARPLPGTSDDLWTGTDRKVRNQVRKAQKEGLVATDGGPELLEEFYDVFSRNMKDLGTPVYSRRLFSQTLQLFPDRARIFLVRHGGRALAGGFALRFQDTVTVPWASSLREYRSLCPNMLLYWTMLERATLDGVRVFDFGRSSPGGGTHQFKRQWGADETPLHWEYILLTRATAPDYGPANPKFAAAIEAWKRCPLWLANALGPHIVRSIP